jgi:ribosome maturation factor RimP
MQGGSRRGSHLQAKSKAIGREAKPRAAQAGPLPDSDRLTRLLEPVVHAMDMDLESVKVASAGRRRVLRVIVDADGGVSLDDIALASRELSAELDDATVMGEQPYTLEVSSPGVDRPLTEHRHWRRAVGRLVTVTVTDSGSSEPVSGRICAADADGVTLDVDGARRHFAYTALGPGAVQVEFGQLPKELGATGDGH